MSIDKPVSQRQECNLNDQNINYIDTYVEYFAEVLLKYENAIPETKNRQPKELQQHNHITLIFQPQAHVVAILFHKKSNKQILNYIDKNTSLLIKELKPPPIKLPQLHPLLIT